MRPHGRGPIAAEGSWLRALGFRRCKKSRASASALARYSLTLGDPRNGIDFNHFDSFLLLVAEDTVGSAAAFTNRVTVVPELKVTAPYERLPQKQSHAALLPDGCTVEFVLRERATAEKNPQALLRARPV